MYKRRLKNIIWVDPSGCKECHPVDDKGILVEGYKKSKKKNVKNRKLVLSFIPPGLVSHKPPPLQMETLTFSNQPLISYSTKEPQPIEYSPQTPSSPETMSSPPSQPPKQTLTQISNSKIQQNDDSFPFNFFLDAEEESYDSMSSINSCKSSTDISVLSFNEDYSDIFEISSLFEF